MLFVGVWRFVTTTCGEQFVMTPGAILTLRWCAESLGLDLQVSIPTEVLFRGWGRGEGHETL